ncbi:MAG: hypothetical protein A2234_00795 [Elusimicrobia bacterium RIFOXYA2_FULL_58_8]|nr:MAG: hypothetical protein A2285_06085 [Elusimicrobia bacterium RIFOXYA12_FULL_57_11]OGS12216.1 MAG: hypothetical protein A2234_00795 [Elusimicrobia bacterium RIFOXYA2_FULL_58_8]
MKGLADLTFEQIERYAENLLIKIDPAIINMPQPLPICKITDYVVEKYSVCISYHQSLKSENNFNVLAKYDRSLNTIFVSSEIRYTSRFRYILAHEIGHLMLHRNVQFEGNEYFEQANEKKEYDILSGKRKLKTERDFLEWQASTFASALIIPRRKFKEKLNILQKSMGISKRGYIYRDSNRYNRFDYHKTLALLAELYGVAKTNVACRLKSLNLIKGSTRWVQGLWRKQLETGDVEQGLLFDYF